LHFVPDVVQYNHSKGQDNKPKYIKEANKMSTLEMDGKIKELRELRRMAEELNAEIETIQDAIKAEMTAQGVDTLTGSDWKCSWKVVVSNRLDSTALKKELPDIAARFMKETTSRRFTVA
jgi:predicted phage-related endonuclease